ncbi:hypothetical protein CspHIS471_0210970 [Cutaneotrichosporon sp. HIS471]|nr:hypothetical protein CspHIS471_0210970 [Cutaneotrichosporon sp. HIS471]
MPRGGARAPPIVDGEPSRRVSEIFPRLESGPSIKRIKSRSGSESIPTSLEIGVDSVPPYDGARGYRGTASSDVDARIQSVWARLERDHPPHPNRRITTNIPITTPTAAPRLAPPLPSVIHTLLPSASRASAAAALAHLEINPAKLNPAAVAALDTWAYHTNDEHTRKRLRLLARGEGVRIFPIDHGKRWNHASWKLERTGHRRPNKFLWQKYPPLTHYGGGIRDLLRHQHALLLSGKGYPLDEMLGFLHAMNADATHRLDALHLALAYANAKQVKGLLDAFKQPHTARITLSRQTLHLAILTHLRRPTRIDDLKKLLIRFPNRTPGPETWRHIAKHALAHDDALLTSLAFDAAKAELGALRSAAERDPEPKPFPIMRNDPDPHPDTAFEAGRATAANPPPPRFLHIGKHTTRWNFLLHACGDRGWAVRGPAPEGESPVPGLLRRWTWLGEEGSFQRRTDLVREDEVLAAAEMEAAPKPRISPKSSPKAKSQAAAEEKAEDDTTPPNFGLGLGRRVVIDGTAYRVQKFAGRKVAHTSWMRRRTRALRMAQKHAEESTPKPRPKAWEDWDEPYVPPSAEIMADSQPGSKVKSGKKRRK